MSVGQNSEIRLRPIRSVTMLPTVRAIFALMLREMTASYGRTPGGYLWAVASPAAGIGLLVAVFSLAFRSPPIGNNFALFYATGMLPFLVFSTVGGLLAASINYSKSLLAYPGVTFIDAIASRFILNLATQILSSTIIFSCIFLIYDTQAIIDFQRITSAFALVAALTLGIGTLNCFMASMYPIYQTVWGILTRPLMILSGVIFPFDAVPQPYQDYLWYNPLIHVIGQMRSGFYPGYDAPYVSLEYVYGISLVTGLFGLIFLRRYYKFILFN